MQEVLRASHLHSVWMVKARPSARERSADLLFKRPHTHTNFALFTYSNASSYNILAARKITPKRKKIQIIPMSEKAANVDFYLKRKEERKGETLFWDEHVEVQLSSKQNW